MSTKQYLGVIVLFDLLFLLFGVHSLSISYKEAIVFYDARDFLHYLVQFSTYIFGQNDLALRAPFIFFHLLSIPLMYEISKFYLKKDEDRLLSVVVFVLLPGVVSSALLVNSASVVIFFTLLFIYLFLYKRENLYSLLLPSLVFIDNSFLILYLALFAYAIYSKNRYLTILSAMLFLISLYLYGFGVHGKPRGYFLDTFGAYSLIFSPLIFLYFFYTMYRIFVKGEKSILWFISFVALIFSILVSFRQRIIIEDYAPFVVISIPLMVQLFLKSYRTRLPQLRGWHKIFFAFVFSFLVLNFLATYFNQYFYRFLEHPQKHFAYKYHIAKELAKGLKEKGVDHISSTDTKLLKRLKFYGISEGSEYEIKEDTPTSDLKSVTISYINNPIISYSVTKVNN
jgi:4-amino-4-deoxy-L-arabinose transferase-like glycosyltransferase